MNNTTLCPISLPFDLSLDIAAGFFDRILDPTQYIVECFDYNEPCKTVRYHRGSLQYNAHDELEFMSTFQTYHYKDKSKFNELAHIDGSLYEVRDTRFNHKPSQEEIIHLISDIINHYKGLQEYVQLRT